MPSVAQGMEQGGVPSSHPWEALFVPDFVFCLPGPWRTQQVVPRWPVAKLARGEETRVEMSDGTRLRRPP